MTILMMGGGSGKSVGVESSEGNNKTFYRSWSCCFVVVVVVCVKSFPRKYEVWL